MGGTAVVGKTDNSALYYNPGAIGFIDSTRITASSYVYGFEYTRLKNGGGNGIDLKSLRVNIIPQLLAGGVVFKKVPRLKLVMGTLTRSRTNVRYVNENEGYYDVINGAEGLERYQARVEYYSGSIEQWAGFGFAYRINEQWSVGAAAYGAYTHMEVRSTQSNNTDAVNNGVPYTASVNEYNSMILNQLSQVFKVGVSAHFKHVHLGAALTTPGFKIWGDGKMEKTFEVHNLNTFATDTTLPAQQRSSYLIADIQRGLKTNYRVPLSASLGIKLVYPRFSLAISAEYFNGSKNQLIMAGSNQTVVRPTTNRSTDTLAGFMKLQTTILPVVNAGFGAEVVINNHVSALFGARTDFSNQADYLPNNMAFNIPSAQSPKWDYVYLSTGFSYKLSMHNLTAGFDYGIGFSRSNTQVFNITEPTQDNYLRGNLQNSMKASIHKLNFILSYTYFFTAKERRHGPFTFLQELGKQKKKKKGAAPVMMN